VVFKAFYPLSAICALALPLWLGGCATDPSISRTTPSATDTQAWAAASTVAGATTLGEWEHYVLPTKRATQFSAHRLHGRDSMKAQAQSSASMLRRKLRIEPDALGTLHFSWLVEALIADSNMGVSAKDDSPVRIVLAFEGDRSKFSVRNAMLSELAHALTGEPMPYATLMYSWCVHCKQSEIITNPRTDRIRTKVVEIGDHSLGHWREYDRDIRADFQAAFGEAPGALVAIGVMTDADNTDSHAIAWYGPLKLHSYP
jgi:Protein of unknown function (DUF3047)